ncbi:5781_t:CDS:2 [Racocetra persica]|uniref:5781_t:CDS:1 n=1 Tax=Racocetra persica TaxID=160502 RepID=A0ACA9K9D9_9GLOM|nr:5781_t:CDS:2 [Racocetra persica]
MVHQFSPINIGDAGDADKIGETLYYVPILPGSPGSPVSPVSSASIAVLPVLPNHQFSY